MKNTFFDMNFEEIENFNIYFERNLSKLEKKILLLLIKNKDSNKVVLGKLHLKNLGISRELLNNSLLRIFSKNISFEVIVNNIKSEGFFKIINFFKHDSKGSFEIFLTDEFLSIIKNYTLTSNFDLMIYLNLKSKKSEKFYEYLVKNKLFLTTSFEAPIEDLKNLFSVEDKYERFHDFNSKVISAVCNELSTAANLEIKYSLVKNGNFINNKVVALKFYIKKEDEEKPIAVKLNDIFSIIKHEVRDFSKIKKELEKYILKLNYEYVENNVKYALKNFENNFDDFLVLCLEENYYEKKFDKPLFQVEKIIKNSLELHNELMKSFKEIDGCASLDNTFSTTNFFRILYSLKQNQKTAMAIGKYRVEIEYNKNQRNSIIQIFRDNKF